MTEYSWWPLGLYTLGLAVITIATTFVTPETRGRDLNLIDDAGLDRSGKTAATT